MGWWLLWHCDRLHFDLDAFGSMLNTGSVQPMPAPFIDMLPMEHIRKGRSLLSEEVLKELAHNERALWRKYGMRIKVDSVSADHTKLLCTASRTGWSILHANMPDHEVVEHAAGALACLRKEGVMALVSVVHKSHKPQFQRMDTRTPFGIHAADVAVPSERKVLNGQRQPAKSFGPVLIVAA